MTHASSSSWSVVNRLIRKPPSPLDMFSAFMLPIRRASRFNSSLANRLGVSSICSRMEVHRKLIHQKRATFSPRRPYDFDKVSEKLESELCLFTSTHVICLFNEQEARPLMFSQQTKTVYYYLGRGSLRCLCLFWMVYSEPLIHETQQCNVVMHIYVVVHTSDWMWRSAIHLRHTCSCPV